MVQLIDGKTIAADIQTEIKGQVSAFSQQPCLAVILVGENPASGIYVKRKREACAAAGIASVYKHFPVDLTEEELLHEIHLLNNDENVDGILVQLPLPKHINPQIVTLAIDPHKDVDGFHPLNVGKLLNGEVDGFVPCTPLGIKVMLQRSHIETAGRHVVVFGRSNIVGKPMAALLMQNCPGGNATVTVVHSRSQNINLLGKMADIIIAAIGQPNFITAEMVKDGAVVIDVGINKVDDPSRPAGYKIVGDVDFEQVKEKCSHITPVPGGVGPLTIAMLLHNTVASHRKRHGL